MSSLEDAVEAARGGADRLEVVRDLSRDGLTPSVDLVRRIQRAVPLPLRVMVRESDGFTCTSDEERRRLVEQAAMFNALSVEGIVIGWTRDGRVDQETLDSVLNAAPALQATFHRAFDSLPDPEAALRLLKRTGQIDRVLTGAARAPGACGAQSCSSTLDGQNRTSSSYRAEASTRTRSAHSPRAEASPRRTSDAPRAWATRSRATSRRKPSGH